MSTEILYLSPEHLSPEILLKYIYPNGDLDLYWSDCWTDTFYVDLARAGFITIADRDHSVLIVEMHKNYSVLDWSDLHVSRHVRKMVSTGRLVDDDIYLTVEKNVDKVVKGIVKAYGSQCWLIKPYEELLKRLETFSGKEFSFVSVQLWCGKQKALLGGELGYTIGATYTSLSGFLDRGNPISNNMGTVQLVALGRLLEQCGYAFWNLGQPHMQYKTDLGAKTTPRLAFLQRFLPAGDGSPSVPLAQKAGVRFSCQELLDRPVTAHLDTSAYRQTLDERIESRRTTDDSNNL
jgi:Leu/Phe-tRNA-protein transferase